MFPTSSLVGGRPLGEGRFSGGVYHCESGCAGQPLESGTPPGDHAAPVHDGGPGGTLGEVLDVGRHPLPIRTIRLRKRGRYTRLLECAYQAMGDAEEVGGHQTSSPARHLLRHLAACDVEVLEEHRVQGTSYVPPEEDEEVGHYELTDRKSVV